MVKHKCIFSLVLFCFLLDSVFQSCACPHNFMLITLENFDLIVHGVCKYYCEASKDKGSHCVH